MIFFENTEIDIKIAGKGGEQMLGYDTSGRSLNIRRDVFRRMIVALVFHYQCLPDFRTLTYHQIEFFYDSIRGHLKGGK